MARLFSSGFELNSTTANVELTTSSGSAFSIQNSVVRSGTYSLKISGLSIGVAAWVAYQYASAKLTGPIFSRFYLYVSALPTQAVEIFQHRTATGTSTGRIALKIDNTGALTLFNSTTQIGSASSALNLNQWYRIEMKFDASQASGSQVLEAAINGSVFATANNLTLGSSTGYLCINFGGNIQAEAQSAGTWYFDDLAINDNTGSFQNSYPGEGSIIHLLPATTGDTNSFATQTGGTSGSTFNYTRVNEVTPDDATTFNGSNTLNQEDLFQLQKIYFEGTPSVVQIGGRFANNVADATTAIKFECIKVSGGTKSQSPAIIPNTTTWNTNATAAPRNYPLTLYQDPDSVNWTQNTLNTMQIGYLISAGSTNAIDVSKVWALVETSGPCWVRQPMQTNNYEFMRVGDGMSVGDKIR